MIHRFLAWLTYQRTQKFNRDFFNNSIEYYLNVWAIGDPSFWEECEFIATALTRFEE